MSKVDKGSDRLHRPGGAGHPSGREGLQDEEPGRPGADDARLPEAQRGVVGRGEVPAEAGGEPREEEARALLKNGGAGGDRAPRAAGPGLQRAGPQEAPADSPAGVPGTGEPHRGEGPDGPAERRGQAGAGPQAQEPGPAAAGGPGDHPGGTTW